MLTWFTIDQQQFDRVRTMSRETSNGRTVRLGVWAARCADCGKMFSQVHRD
jgi:hypothetical protein